MDSFLSSLKQSLLEKKLQIQIVDDRARTPAYTYSTSPNTRSCCEQWLLQQQQHQENYLATPIFYSLDSLLIPISWSPSTTPTRNERFVSHATLNLNLTYFDIHQARTE
jgi:hypothetical protein